MSHQQDCTFNGESTFNSIFSTYMQCAGYSICCVYMCPGGRGERTEQKEQQRQCVSVWRRGEHSPSLRLGLFSFCRGGRHRTCRWTDVCRRRLAEFWLENALRRHTERWEYVQTPRRRIVFIMIYNQFNELRSCVREIQLSTNCWFFVSHSKQKYFHVKTSSYSETAKMNWKIACIKIHLKSNRVRQILHRPQICMFTALILIQLTWQRIQNNVNVHLSLL